MMYTNNTDENKILENIINMYNIIEYKFKDNKRKNIIVKYIFFIFHEINKDNNENTYYIINNNIYIILKSFIKTIKYLISIYTRKYSYFYLNDFIKIFIDFKKNINNQNLLDKFIKYFRNNINDDLIIYR